MARQRPEPEKRIGILTGWRCWTVLREEGLLRPIYQRGMIWKPRETYEAFCAAADTNRQRGVHPVPWKECKCGIWSVCHPMLLQEVSWNWKDDETLVVGQVALWGRVIEFERGWRAQFGYPTHLYALSDDELLAQALRDRYGVPVAVGAQARALERVLPPNLQAPGRAARATRDDDGEMPGVPFALAGVTELVQATEVTRLERLREDLRHEQAQLEESREALKLERAKIKVRQQALEAEEQRQGAAAQQAALAARRAAGKRRDPALQSDLRAALSKHGIRQTDIAAAAGVSRTAVCHALSGRSVSRRVIETAQRLVREAEQRAKRGHKVGASRE